MLILYAMNVASLSNKEPRALITGLEGFTGRYLKHSLQQAGYRVFGTSHSAKQNAADIYTVDLCDREALKQVVSDVQPDVVAHLAAIAFVAHGDVDAVYRTNVVGTRNLLDALHQAPHQPHAVLLASSANIYGNATVSVIDETVSPSPANDYAVSKLAMEFMAQLWMDKLPIFIVRPFNYTGVGQASQYLLPKIVDHFRRGEKIIELGNIEVERDFSDVRRVVDAYTRLIQKAPIGGIFNVCSGQAISLKSVISLMEKIAGYHIEVRVNPNFVRTNEVHRLQGDTRRLEKEIGPLKNIMLEDTLRWMFETEKV